MESFLVHVQFSTELETHVDSFVGSVALLFMLLGLTYPTSACYPKVSVLFLQLLA